VIPNREYHDWQYSGAGTQEFYSLNKAARQKNKSTKNKDAIYYDSEEEGESGNTYYEGDVVEVNGEEGTYYYSRPKSKRPADKDFVYITSKGGKGRGKMSKKHSKKDPCEYYYYEYDYIVYPEEEEEEMREEIFDPELSLRPRTFDEEYEEEYNVVVEAPSGEMVDAPSETAVFEEEEEVYPVVYEDDYEDDNQVVYYEDENGHEHEYYYEPKGPLGKGSKASKSSKSSKKGKSAKKTKVCYEPPCK
jgi:hypothetical protein